MRAAPLGSCLLAATALGCSGAPPPVVGAPLPDHTVRFIVGGDARDDAAHVLPWAFGEARARGATAFFFLGDMELTPSLDEHFRAELALLGPVGFYPALGNHEVNLFGFARIAHEAAEAAFRKRFLGTPRTPIHSSIPDKVVYGVTLPGGVHFIMLDNVSQRGFGADQLAWLKADLASARADASVKYIVVGMHKPLAKNGLTTHSMDADGAVAVQDSDAALQLLADAKASLMVASHVHAFALSQMSGIPFFISGGLGAPLDRGGPSYSFHHFLQIDVNDQGLHVTVVRFDGARSQGDGEDRD